MISLSTKSKIKCASLISNLLVLFLGNKSKIIKRSNINYCINLREGIDLGIFLGINNEASILNVNKIMNINKKKTIIDIGANIGSVSLPLAKTFKNSKIISIEPTVYAFSKLKKNVNLNPYLKKRIILQNIFISNKKKITKEVHSSWNFLDSGKKHKVHLGILKKTSLTLAAFVSVLTFGPELVFVNNQAKAAEFPTKPIKVYVGFKPGGRTDMIARLIANHITEKKLLSQPIVIVNKPGAAAANAARAVLAAKPDGHTILHWSHQLLITNAMKVNKLHPEDFTTIGYTGGGSPVWTVREDAPFNSLKDLTDQLKSKPKSLVEAVGIGTIPHLIGVQLTAAAGV